MFVAPDVLWESDRKPACPAARPVRPVRRAVADRLPGLLLIVKVALATSLGGFPLTTAIALTVVVLSTVSGPRQNPLQRPRKGCRTVAEWITSAR